MMMRIMCCRVRPSLLHLRSLRPLGTATSSAVFKQSERLSASLAFEDPSAFKVKSLGELLRALGVFCFCSFPVLVNNCGKVRHEFAHKRLEKG